MITAHCPFSFDLVFINISFIRDILQIYCLGVQVLSYGTNRDIITRETQEDRYCVLSNTLAALTLVAKSP